MTSRERYVRIQMLEQVVVTGPEIGETIYLKGHFYMVPVSFALSVCHLEKPKALIDNLFASEQDMDSQEAADLLESLQPVPPPPPPEEG